MVKSSTPSQPSRQTKKPTKAEPAKQKSGIPSTDAKADKSRTISLVDDGTLTREKMLAEFALSGVASSAMVSVAFSTENYSELSLNECVAVLVNKSKYIHKGKLDCVETMLMSQAVALDTVFASLARRAQANMGQYVDTADRYMRLALKAQGQCRATLETLAAIKNPPVVIARQANVSHGPQQVNNTVNMDGTFETSTRTPAHAENSNSLQNELLEEGNE